MKRSCIILTAILSTVIATLSCVFANGEEYSVNPNELAKMKEQSSALENALSVKRSFSDDEYGGMYIDENNRLHVMVLTENSKVKKAAQTDGTVVFDSAEYSKKSLCGEMDRIYDYAVKNGIHCSMTLDESTNKINISADISKLKDIINGKEEMFVIDSSNEAQQYCREKCASY